MDHQIYARAVCRPLDLTDVAITGGFWKRVVGRGSMQSLCHD